MVAAAGIVHAPTAVAVGIVAEVAGPTPVVAEAVAEIEEAVDPTAGIDPIVAGAVAVVVVVAPSHFA